MFTKLTAQRSRLNVLDSESALEMNIEVTEYGLPLDVALVPAVALAIDVGLAMIPMGPFLPSPPPSSPPLPGAATPMVLDILGLDPPLEAANDVAGIVIPEPIAEEQESGHHHHQQYQHQRNFPPPTFLQQTHPTSFPSSSSAEGGRVAVDSSVTNSAL
ncbi:hypothetical protein K457DRAFT_1821352 [Linnemannia elongata AG-77]|uniref:Uncharacterized protein n=1 Tax=Linnemannia elongata AG-77 TaxID=1314771 RepID=A0A197JQB9_9FUNG|nr:hypothetical protein K457DRAFT_1821352 [Linnemannia elongata AG-77]